MDEIDPIIQREAEIIHLFEVAMEQRYPIFCSIFGHNTSIFHTRQNIEENPVNFDFESLEIYEVEDGHQESNYAEDLYQNNFDDIIFPESSLKSEPINFIDKEDIPKGPTIEEMQNLNFYLENHVIDDDALDPNYVGYVIQELVAEKTES